jgi:hypothetical protein
MKRLGTLAGIVASVLLMAVAGFAWRSNKQATLPHLLPHTIVYHLDRYDDKGEKIIFSETIVRHVAADNSWHNTMLFPDGRIFSSHGTIKSPATNRAVTPDLPEHLGVKYVVSKGDAMEVWVSPELQDGLKYTAFHEDGTLAYIQTAVNVDLLKQ